jgi:hypothetical protein
MPVDDFFPRERSFVEEVYAGLVADVPAVDVLNSTVHLLFGDLLWFVDHGCEDACFGDASLPQF